MCWLLFASGGVRWNVSYVHKISSSPAVNRKARLVITTLTQYLHKPFLFLPRQNTLSPVLDAECSCGARRNRCCLGSDRCVFVATVTVESPHRLVLRKTFKFICQTAKSNETALKFLKFGVLWRFARMRTCVHLAELERQSCRCTF